MFAMIFSPILMENLRNDLKYNNKENIKNILSPSHAKLTHREIINGLKQGDEAILGYVYNKHVHDLFRFGNQFTQDKELILDSIHDVFVVLITKPKLLRKIKSIKSYLFTSLYHRIIYQLKRNKKSENYNKQISDTDFKIEFSEQSRLIFSESKMEDMQKVKEAINQLSGKQRQAILHYYFNGFLHAEIADIMSLKSANSVAKLIARGLNTLRQLVQAISIMLISLL